jgi:hypothetical protein
LLSRRGCSVPANASGFDRHRASITSRVGQEAGRLTQALEEERARAQAAAAAAKEQAAQLQKELQAEKEKGRAAAAAATTQAREAEGESKPAAWWVAVVAVDQQMPAVWTPTAPQ